MRKRLKRLRYLAAFAAPAFDGGVDAWKARVSAAQDPLGEYIDLALAARRFASLTETDPYAGWLRAKAEASTRAARKSLQRLRDVKNFW